MFHFYLVIALERNILLTNYLNSIFEFYSELCLTLAASIPFVRNYTKEANHKIKTLKIQWCITLLKIK